MHNGKAGCIALSSKLPGYFYFYVSYRPLLAITIRRHLWVVEQGENAVFIFYQPFAKCLLFFYVNCND